MKRRQRPSRAITPNEKQCRALLKELHHIMRPQHAGSTRLSGRDSTPEEVQKQQAQRRLCHRLRARFRIMASRERNVLDALMEHGFIETKLAGILRMSPCAVRTSLRRIYCQIRPCLPEVRAYLHKCRSLESEKSVKFTYHGRLPKPTRPKDSPRTRDLIGYNQVGFEAVLSKEEVAEAMRRKPRALPDNRLWWVVAVIPLVVADHPDWPADQVETEARRISQAQAEALGEQVYSDDKFYEHNVSIGVVESDWHEDCDEEC